MHVYAATHLDPPEISTTPAEDKLIEARARELAAEDINDHSIPAVNWVLDTINGDNGYDPCRHAQAVILSALTYDGYPSAVNAEVFACNVRRLRDAYVERRWEHYRDAAVAEFAEDTLEN